MWVQVISAALADDAGDVVVEDLQEPLHIILRSAGVSPRPPFDPPTSTRTFEPTPAPLHVHGHHRVHG